VIREGDGTLGGLYLLRHRAALCTSDQWIDLLGFTVDTANEEAGPSGLDK